MSLVTEIARAACVPVYGSSATMVDSGAFATIAVSDQEIGARSADISSIPAVVVPASSTVINKTTMEALGLSIDDPEITFVEDPQ